LVAMLGVLDGREMPKTPIPSTVSVLACSAWWQRQQPLIWSISIPAPEFRL
jgi:hypothetical protein